MKPSDYRNFLLKYQALENSVHPSDNNVEMQDPSSEKWNLEIPDSSLEKFEAAIGRLHPELC